MTACFCKREDLWPQNISLNTRVYVAEDHGSKGVICHLAETADYNFAWGIFGYLGSIELSQVSIIPTFYPVSLS